MGLGHQGCSVVILPRPLATFWDAFGINVDTASMSELEGGAGGDGVVAIVAAAEVGVVVHVEVDLGTHLDAYACTHEDGITISAGGVEVESRAAAAVE